MRIIAGEFKGRRLAAPKGQGTRPTTDRVRESLMSALASVRGGFDGAVVVDAFAGSGALGLEALSRGAESARFYERDGAAYKVLCDNIAMLKLDAGTARVQRADVLKEPPLRVRPAFDLLFLDPPYALEAEVVFGLLGRLYQSGAIVEDAIVAYEHDAGSNDAIDALASGMQLELSSRRSYGDTVVDIFCK